MVDKKNIKDVTNNQDEWDFSSVRSPAQNENESPALAIEKTKTTKINQKKKLTLETSSIARTKTRSSMASEVYGNSKDDKDLLDYAGPVKRLISGGLDVAFWVGLYLGAKTSTPFLRVLCQQFLNRYALKFTLPEPVLLNVITGIALFLLIFFLHIIPTSFFNLSFGKKILGLRVRGRDRYTLTISQSFYRELIFKPISLASVIGVLLIFTSKQRLALHDRIMETVVVEE